MMSLFSSFDLYFYPLFLLSLFFTFLMFLSHKNFSITQSLKGGMIMFFEKFFNTLKIKSSNKVFISILITMVMVLIFLNLSSIFSYNFAFSSQISTVLCLSLMFWVSINIFFLFYSLNNFLIHLIPQGSPIYLTLLLFLIEIVSNLIRPLTLTVRLTANILAGHLLMILLSKLVFISGAFSFFYIALNTVEILVALIQSYIFTTMICLYYSELN